MDEKELWSRGLQSASSLMLLRWSVVQNASEIDGPTIGLIRAAGNQALCALPRSQNDQIIESWLDDRHRPMPVMCCHPSGSAPALDGCWGPMAAPRSDGAGLW